MCHKNRLLICVRLCALSFLVTSCLPGPSHKKELKISIDDSGTRFLLNRSEKLQSVGMFAIWEKDSGHLVWAISGVYPHIDELIFGDPPKAYKADGWTVDNLRQLYPKDNKRPAKLSTEKTYYLVAEMTIDYMLDRSLDMVIYELNTIDGKFVMTLRTDKAAYKLPSNVSQLWDAAAGYWEKKKEEGSAGES